MTQPHPYRRLIASLFGTLKLMQMYGPKHDATEKALVKLTGAIRDACTDEDRTTIKMRGSRIQVNGQLMRSADCGNLALAFLSDECYRRGIQAIHFKSCVVPNELSSFTKTFLELDLTRPEPAARLIAALAVTAVDSVTVDERTEVDTDPALLEERRETAMRTYLRGLKAFKDVLRADGHRDKTTLRRTRRAVQGLVDRFVEDETAVLALAQISGHDPKLFHHSLNVCIYSLAIGQRLGMSRHQLGELGLAALFHDVGKTTKGSESKWDGLRDHPSRGARLLLDENTAHGGMLKAAVVAYEHHAQHDGLGYPEMEHEMHLYSRIVAAADCYDGLTSASTYRDRPYPNADALSLMHAKAGSLFDPAIVKVLAAAMGTHPIGSLVELESGEIAMVIEGGTDPERPLARIVNTARGTRAIDEVIDLSERDEQSGEHFNGVVRMVPPGEVFDSVGDFISAI